MVGLRRLAETKSCAEVRGCSAEEDDIERNGEPRMVDFAPQESWPLREEEEDDLEWWLEREAEWQGEEALLIPSELGWTAE